MKLALYYPAKPYKIAQRWGIYNPAYEQFGFNRHNGEDFLLGADSHLYAPLPVRVVEVGNIPAGSGVFVRTISTEKWDVDGIECYVEVLFMHCEKILVTKGQVLKVGDLVAKADNTGFSTGPHTHGLFRRLSSPTTDYEKTRLDTDPATNYTFDPHPYWTGFAAQDYNTLLALVQRLTLLVKAWRDNKSK